MGETTHETKRLLTNPEKELIGDAAQQRLFEDIPDELSRNHRETMAIFGAPGIRALGYVIVDGDPWPVTSSFRDLTTFQAPDATGRVDLSPFGDPASLRWRPDAGETAAEISLALNPIEPDGDQYLATSDEDTPHIILGWHEVPEP